MAGFDAIRQQLAALLHLHPGVRPWHHPLLCALCIGLPAMCGAASGHFAESLGACMGALAIVYLPAKGPRQQRWRLLLACAAALLLCTLAGMLASAVPGTLTGSTALPLTAALALALVAAVSTYFCRYFSLPPPGNFFFVMAAAIAGCRPVAVGQMPGQLGIIALGSLSACLLGCLYLHWINTADSASTEAAARAANTRLRDPAVEHSVAVITAIFVGGSLWIAMTLQLDNPYWVPTSCAAIMQGASPRASWIRKLQRITGTAIGLVPTAWIFAFAPGNGLLALIITGLSFSIEWLIARNYGLAVIFITPLTIIFAEGQHPYGAMLPFEIARLRDVMLGSAIGFAGSVALYQILQLKPKTGV